MTPWKKASALCLCLCVVTPSSLVLAEETAAPASSSPAATTGRPLRRLVIGESVEAVQSVTVPPDGGFVVISPAFGSFDIPELTKRLSAAQDKVIEERILAAIAQVIENFVRQNEYPAASAIVPTQNIADGVVRVIVLLGKKGAWRHPNGKSGKSTSKAPVGSASPSCARNFASSRAKRSALTSSIRRSDGRTITRFGA